MSTLRLSRTVEALNNDEKEVTIVTEAHSSWTTGWLAEITEINEDKPGGLGRKFMPYDTESLSRAGNGSKAYVIDSPGVYEADSVWRSYKSHRTYFVVNGNMHVEVLGSTSYGWHPSKLRDMAKEAFRDREDA